MLVIILGWAMDQCISMGGNLKDGIKGEGQYCYLREDGVRYTYDEGKAKCESLSGTLPIIKTIEAHTMFYKHECSQLDQENPGRTSCPGVSNSNKYS